MAKDVSIKANRDRSPNIELNPAQVRLTGRRPPDLLKWMPRWEHRGLPWPLRRGYWDRFVSDFSEHPTFREVEALIAVDLDYERLPSFRAALRQLKTRKRARLPQIRRNRAFASEREIRSHFEDVVGLIRSIRDEGYQLDQAGGIGLGIGRHGQLIKLKHGHHRLAVAQQLGVKRVRFRVIAVHPSWFLRRLPSDTETLSQALRQTLNY